MKPWRAAETSATASGKSTRIASRSTMACASTGPSTRSCLSAEPVSSTAVFSVSVANCSRCDSCIASVCLSANSRSPRMRSSGSPPNGKPNPPSISVLSSSPRNVCADGRQPLRRLGQRADRLRVRRLAAVRGDRRLLRRRDAAPAGGALLSPGGGGAEPRHDARPVPAGRRPAGHDPGRRSPADGLRGRRRPRLPRARAGEARHRADQRPGGARTRGERPRRRSVPRLVPEGAARGSGEHVRPPGDREAGVRVQPPPRRGLPLTRPGRGAGRGPLGAGSRRRSPLAERPLVTAEDVGGELLGGGDAALHGLRERRAAGLPERPLEAGRDDADELLPVRGVRPGCLPGGGQLLLERHRRNNSPVPVALTGRNRAALELFATLAGGYDRYARLFSFGQDPRWRSFLVSRLEVGADDTVLDVATGTAAGAPAPLPRRGRRGGGGDQSPQML